MSRFHRAVATGPVAIVIAMLVVSCSKTGVDAPAAVPSDAAAETSNDIVVTRAKASRATAQDATRAEFMVPPPPPPPRRPHRWSRRR